MIDEWRGKAAKRKEDVVERGKYEKQYLQMCG